jgi:hypothetical protein
MASKPSTCCGKSAVCVCGKSIFPRDRHIPTLLLLSLFIFPTTLLHPHHWKAKHSFLSHHHLTYNPLSLRPTLANSPPPRQPRKPPARAASNRPCSATATRPPPRTPSTAPAARAVPAPSASATARVPATRTRSRAATAVTAAAASRVSCLTF